jgi:hypothetical protein
MSITAAITAVTGLVSEFIEDPDKAKEIDLELQRLQLEIDKELLRTGTNTWVDPFVKFLIAFRDLIIPLIRPLGSAAMTGFALYCAMNDIQLSGATEAILVAAFPGWMTSRHIHKKQEKTKQRHNEDTDDEDFYE